MNCSLDYEYDKILTRLLDNETIRISPTKNACMYNMVIDELKIDTAIHGTNAYVKLYMSDKYVFGLTIIFPTKNYNLCIDSNNNIHVFEL